MKNDAVRLQEDFAGIKRDTPGFVIERFGDSVEVEFQDSTGRPYSLFPVPSNKLRATAFAPA